jgi:oxygen-independent coproporphyrinogen-3 oxidase
MPSDPGLYIHVPFCITKCHYCAFYSTPLLSDSVVSDWLSALKKELLYYTDRFDRFDSLYLGGGTPTCLASDCLRSIMEAVLTRFEFASDTEFTIEANPGDLTEKKIDFIKTLGFKRINVGVQSFQESELKFLGRRHSVEEAVTALRDLRSAGFENVGIDLIYGLPDQTVEGWLRNVYKALVFKPEHISCYQLTLDKGTPLGQMKASGAIIPPDEKKERSFFQATSSYLKEKGYLHYEISSFAKGPGFFSRHNMKYWNRGPYLGIGPAAHSFLRSKRWWNFKDLVRYCRTLEQGRAPIEGYEILTDEQTLLEYVALGLRTSDGIALEKVNHVPGVSDAIYRLASQGFIRIRQGRAVPTVKGFLVADSLPLSILP